MWLDGFNRTEHTGGGVERCGLAVSVLLTPGTRESTQTLVSQASYWILSPQ
jgi:hypothetical protein